VSTFDLPYVVVSHDVWPMFFQDGIAEGFDLTLHRDSEPSALESEIEPTDAREE
jgi:hypothetical protein